jgi:pimeloyl-ACP methyl ester carboxylesterase
MGAYDIPAMIEKVLQVSGNEKLFYIGHSMGTTGYSSTEIAEKFLRSTRQYYRSQS